MQPRTPAAPSGRSIVAGPPSKADILDNTAVDGVSQDLTGHDLLKIDGKPASELTEQEKSSVERIYSAYFG